MQKMSDWARKNLNSLHYAVGNEIKKLRYDEDYNKELAVIKEVCATTFLNAEHDLQECRSRLCKLCRSKQAYECDVSVGWSSSCAFQASNDT